MYASFDQAATNNVAKEKKKSRKAVTNMRRLPPW